MTAGKTKPGDVIDPEIAVPPGQFATSCVHRRGLSWPGEAIGAVAMGTLL